jgi:hypothetical protein
MKQRSVKLRWVRRANLLQNFDASRDLNRSIWHEIIQTYNSGAKFAQAAHQTLNRRLAATESVYPCFIKDHFPIKRLSPF